MPDFSYQPGPANLATVVKDGETWTLVVTKHFRHAPAVVWQALVDPEQLKHWSPFDASAPLDRVGGEVTLTTVNAPAQFASQTVVTQAEKPRLLVYTWGGRDMRWELEPTPEGTKLTLWTVIDRPYIAMGAAGWHLCLDILGLTLDGNPPGRIVGPDALALPGWQQLKDDYSRQFQA